MENMENMENAIAERISGALDYLLKYKGSVCISGYTNKQWEEAFRHSSSPKFCDQGLATLSRLDREQIEDLVREAQSQKTSNVWTALIMG